MLLCAAPSGGKRKIASEEQLIKLVTGETDVPIKTPPSAAPVRVCPA